jgi:hypothetical protein
MERLRTAWDMEWIRTTRDMERLLTTWDMAWLLTTWDMDSLHAIWDMAWLHIHLSALEWGIGAITLAKHV